MHLNRKQFMLGLGLASLSWVAGAQEFPNKPIRMVIGFPPGGGIDSLARVVAEGLASRLGQSVLIDNRPGAGTAIASAEIIKAQPDGYTIGLGNVGQFSILEHISKQPISDLPSKLTGLGQVGYAPLGLFVPASLNVNTLGEYMAMLKAQPEKYSYGSGGNGQITHLAFELFKEQAKLSIQHIPYKGSAPALTDLIAGRIVGMIDALGVGMPHVKSGKLKVLALSSAERVADVANIPTFKESGLSQYVVTGWQGMVAPAHMPQGVTLRLNRALVETLNSKEVKDKMASLGYYANPSSPAEFDQFMRSESAKWGPLCKALKIEAD